MEWSRLKHNKCPNCGNYPLVQEVNVMKCPVYSKGCTFVISKQKYFNIAGAIPKIKTK